MRAADCKRVAGVRQRRGGERDNRLGAGGLDRGRDAELVTAHAVCIADSVHGDRQALAEAGQEEGVARGIAKRVVVLLEAVEVEEREHDAVGAAVRPELGLEVVDQSPPVGKPRQRVGACLLVAGRGHARVLTGEALGDCTSEGRTAVEEHKRQREEEDRDRRAHRGARVGSRARRSYSRLASSSAPNAPMRLAGNTRQVVCTLAVVGS